jgi:single-strand DNA-binding protein
MKDLNKIILIGRLGADPIQRETKSGISVVQFPLATSRKTKVASDSSESSDSLDLSDLSDETAAKPQFSEETVWHRIIAWGRQGEVCAQRLKKGQSVFVEGSLRTSKYIGKDNISRMSFEVHADSVGFLNLSSGKLPKAPEVELTIEN